MDARQRRDCVLFEEYGGTVRLCPHVLRHVHGVRDGVESKGGVLGVRGRQVGNVVHPIMESVMCAVAVSEMEDGGSEAVVFTAGKGDICPEFGEHWWWR